MSKAKTSKYDGTSWHVALDDIDKRLEALEGVDTSTNVTLSSLYVANVNKRLEKLEYRLMQLEEEKNAPQTALVREMVRIESRVEAISKRMDAYFITDEEDVDQKIIVSAEYNKRLEQLEKKVRELEMDDIVDHLTDPPSRESGYYWIKLTEGGPDFIAWWNGHNFGFATASNFHRILGVAEVNERVERHE